jgi:hypothetical protein
VYVPISPKIKWNGILLEMFGSGRHTRGDIMSQRSPQLVISPCGEGNKLGLIRKKTGKQIQKCFNRIGT